MTVFSGILVFLVTWWIVLLMVLPWGVRTPDEPEPGHAPSAPVQPRLLLKAVVTTAITIVVWLAIYALIRLDVISFRAMTRDTPL